MKKIFLVFSSILFILQGCARFYADDKNIKEKAFLYIPKGASYQQVLDSLSPYLVNLEHFDRFAQNKDYDRYVKPGKFKLSTDDTNASLVEKLINGKEEQVKVRVKNSPTLFHMARDASKGIIADSAQILDAIRNNPTIADRGLDLESAKMYFIPNTYFMLWLTDADGFVNRMVKEHNRFWTDERHQKLAEMGMTEEQVYILASIVQMESPQPDDQKMVAKAYLNRLEKGMKLQADPTSVYAYKLEHGFGNQIKRVLNKHIQMASAYNTYVNFGLPPSAICLPNGTAIDAVLNPAEHDFVYFCANPDRPGYHSFTNSYAEHEKNADKYRKWFREQQRIKREREKADSSK